MILRFISIALIIYYTLTIPVASTEGWFVELAKNHTLIINSE